jgi:hypothetical protein
MADRPALYMTLTYLHLFVRLDDNSVALVSIDRYLNAGITGNPTHPRAVRAGQEKDGLLGAIARELKLPGIPPLVLQIGGRTLNRHDIQMVFAGKGSPSQIRDILWLASRYRRTNPSLRFYCERYIGLDCNGFAGNYWGIDPNTPIDSYDTNRRQKAAEVSIGDALIFYKKGAASPFHLAVVDDVSVHGDKLFLAVVQSAGLELGVHRDELGEQALQKNDKGHLFFTRAGGSQLVFIAAGPAKNRPNP